MHSKLRLNKFYPHMSEQDLQAFYGHFLALEEMTKPEWKRFVDNGELLRTNISARWPGWNVRFLWWSMWLDQPKGHFSERPLSSYRSVRPIRSRPTTHNQVFTFQLLMKGIFYRSRISREPAERI